MNLNKRGLINYLLLPFAGIFYILSVIRKNLYKFNFLKSYQANKLLIIVGNIVVGGTGKTPIVIELTKFFQNKGLKVGVISRGYGRDYNKLVVINQQTNVKQSGDEPMLIYQKTKAKVAISANRVEATKAIENEVDVIISDDGLQHYSLKRDIEIIVFNGFSNGFYLPSGGLREGKNRLKNANIIINNEDKKIIPSCFIASKTNEKLPLDYFNNTKVMAICGIANPQRFFDILTDLAIDFQSKTFIDHYNFRPIDLDYKIPVITTAKDWVKYKDFNLDNIYYLDIDVELNDEVYQYLNNYV